MTCIFFFVEVLKNFDNDTHCHWILNRVPDLWSMNCAPDSRTDNWASWYGVIIMKWLYEV